MTYHIINLEESSLGPIRDNIKHTQKIIYHYSNKNAIQSFWIYVLQNICGVSLCFPRYSPHRTIYLPCGQLIWNYLSSDICRVLNITPVCVTTQSEKD